MVAFNSLINWDIFYDCSDVKFYSSILCFSWILKIVELDYISFFFFFSKFSIFWKKSYLENVVFYDILDRDKNRKIPDWVNHGYIWWANHWCKVHLIPQWGVDSLVFWILRFLFCVRRCILSIKLCIYCVTLFYTSQFLLNNKDTSRISFYCGCTNDVLHCPELRISYV